MLVIDQHALHERILFDQLKSRLRSGPLETQRLLIPEPVELTAEQAARTLEAPRCAGRIGAGRGRFRRRHGAADERADAAEPAFAAGGVAGGGGPSGRRRTGRRRAKCCLTIC